MSKKKVILIDNHDSFTGNLYQIFDEYPKCTINVVSISQVNIPEIDAYDNIVISPGPDVPKSYPKIFDILEKYSSNKSILGVCLGHQCMIEFFGGKIKNLQQVYHGKQELIEVSTDEKLFHGLNSKIKVGLYHSWAADDSCLPSTLETTAISSQNIIMAVSHKTWDCKGIQFHPESYMTEKGKEIINNWL